ncbi:MAG TPA: hypothetical protein DIT73_08940 [Gammaproteobacteria bacterium]|nr:hypothetical protein [Gammaproteobacteria bacterium]|tara:strand:+ start:141 stop:1187 length:1047 start_codon:yes stop_codon:yes gene_type:complete
MSKPPHLTDDPNALSTPLDELGWVNVEPNAADVVELREYLRANNGIRGLEILAPGQVDEATRVFYRDGFVVVRDVLSDDQLAFIRGGCDEVIHEILSRDANRFGNRGSHRYSFGGSSLTGHLVHRPEWSMLVDLPSVTPILTSIFGSANYISRGGGGDFCLPGAKEYQALHADMSDRREYTPPGSTHLYTFGSFHDPRGKLNYRDLPCPYVCCNFLMVDFTAFNGATRQIPGTQHSQQPIPDLSEEPEWMKLSAVCPAPAGSVLIRDVRAWHGGTPNLSDEVRAIPNAEFYAPWFREPMRHSMPYAIFDALSEHGKDVCRFIVADSNEEVKTGYRDDIGSVRPQSKRG